MAKKHKIARVVLAATLALVIATSGVALVSAQTGGSYDLSWNTLDGGGYMFSAGGGYSLGGTIGQPDAGAMNGENYSLAGGFWGGALALYQVYLPVVLRQ